MEELAICTYHYLKVVLDKWVKSFPLIHNIQAEKKDVFWMCVAALQQDSKKVCALSSDCDSEESAISSAREPQQTHPEKQGCKGRTGETEAQTCYRGLASSFTQGAHAATGNSFFRSVRTPPKPEQLQELKNNPIHLTRSPGFHARSQKSIFQSDSRSAGQ